MQTSTMIKATARSAPDREREINNLIRKADFNNDPYVQEFGLTISNRYPTTHSLFTTYDFISIELFTVWAQLTKYIYVFLLLFLLMLQHDGSARTCITATETAVRRTDETASAAKSRRVGYAWQTVLYGRRDPRVGHCLLRSPAHRTRRCPQEFHPAITENQ